MILEYFNITIVIFCFPIQAGEYIKSKYFSVDLRVVNPKRDCDTSYSLHMSESQNDSDTPPHSNIQWYTTYDMFEQKTWVNNKIIKKGESKHLNIARTPSGLKAWKEL